MAKKEGDFKKKLCLSILLGYSGIDKFIFKKIKYGFKRVLLFIISIICFLNFQQILKVIYSFTQKTIISTREFFSFFTSLSFILGHFPKIVGLFSLTILIFVFLILLFGTYILWIDDIIAIVKREDE